MRKIDLDKHRIALHVQTQTVTMVESGLSSESCGGIESRNLPKAVIAVPVAKLVDECIELGRDLTLALGL